MEKEVTNRAPDHAGKSSIPTMEKEVTNRAPDYPSKRVTVNRDSHSWHIVLNKNVLLTSLLAFSVVVIAYMLVEMHKANEKMSEQFEIIDLLQKEIDSLTTKLRGCDELKVHCGKEKQENDKLKRTMQSQSDSVKEAKERESGIREYVQKDVEDKKTRLSETERKHDLANYENKEMTEEIEVLTQEMKVATQEIEVLREKLFGANVELNDYKTENWWHWVFTWSVIFIIVLACCLFSYHNIIGTKEPKRKGQWVLVINGT